MYGGYLKIRGILLFLFFSASLCFAEESFTITTYYPSPYGSYNELRTNTMVIGDMDESSTPAPSQGAVTFSPVSEPAAYSEGTLYYDSSARNFKYRNNSSWQAMDGGMSYTKYCFNDAVYGTPLCGTVVLGTQWLCGAGFTVQKALGSWGYCTGLTGPSFFRPPRG